jgi:hypothetical protein
VFLWLILCFVVGMKILHTPNLMVIVLALSVLKPMDSLAATVLTSEPYFGLDQKKCLVNRPSGQMAEYDSGYIASEDCSWIYLLPPKKVSLETRLGFYTIDLAFDCEHYNQFQEHLKSTNPSDPSYQILFKNFQSFKKIALEKYKDQNVVSMQVEIILNLNRLKKAYELANPDLRAVFLGSALDNGYLDFFISSNEASDAENDRILLQNSRTKLIVRNAAATTIFFDIDQTCQLISKKDQKGMISGTYSFSYPVQVKGLSRYDYDAEGIKKTVQSFFENHKANTFKTTDLVNAIRSTGNGLSAVLSEGAYPGYSGFQKLAFIQVLNAFGYTQVFSALEKQSAIGITANYVDVSSTNEAKECKYFTHFCKDKSWQVFKKEVDWDQFQKDLSDSLSRYSSSGSQYQTLYFNSNSSMIED